MEKLYSTAISEAVDTDVITKFIEKANLKISFVSTMDFEKNKEFRLTLDYPEDLEFFQKVYEKIDVLSTGKTLIDFLDKNQSIPKINFHKHKDYLVNQAKFNEKVR